MIRRRDFSNLIVQWLNGLTATNNNQTIQQLNPIFYIKQTNFKLILTSSCVLVLLFRAALLENVFCATERPSSWGGPSYCPALDKFRQEILHLK